MPLTGLVAYPARPPQVGSTVRMAIDALRDEGKAEELSPWEEVDISGRFIATAVLGKIETGELLVADVTRPNFNVTFEVGFAIGRGKHVLLIRNAALDSPTDLIREVGVFDTLGYSEYTNSQQLASLLSSAHNLDPLPVATEINTRAPVYLVMPKIKTDSEIRVQARIKKVRLPFRSFDPEEHGRLPAGEAIDQVAKSHAVVVPLIATARTGSEVHNIRAAFVAGLAMGMEKALLLLQEGDDPVPIDYRDLVKRHRFPQQIDEYVAEMASQVTERLISETDGATPASRSFLERLDLGASSAENELQQLGGYYLETDEYQRTLRGEVSLVAGRKGSGKTAMFARVRDRLRGDRTRIVLDFKPEGFQLIKLKERVLDFLEEGTQEHTITAFWEYLLLLETCHKILEKDKERHLRDERLFELYTRISDLYGEDTETSEGDFSERMLRLTDRIGNEFGERGSEASGRLSTGEITELIHKHDVATLRDNLIEYLQFKNGLWILFDNLDKGWPPHGVTAADVLTLRCLMDAVNKIERMMTRRDLDCHGVIFIRNDVFDLLQASTSDRGKVSQVLLDWTDSDLLREMLRRRLISDLDQEPPFNQIWPRVCASHIGAEESSQYLIERSLMRPRGLLDLVQYCRGHAVNMGHSKIEPSDIIQGEDSYSSELLVNIGFEIQDVMPISRDILYEFIEEQATLSERRVQELIEPKVGLEWERLLDLLLWYGFLGIVRGESVRYIYDVKYDHKRLKAIAAKRETEFVRYAINPAFWKALEVKRGDRNQLDFSIDSA